MALYLSLIHIYWEVALNKNYTLNQDKIDDEAKYDGFYSVCNNLEDEVTEIIKINKRRWEIEESFRIMKSEFLSLIHILLDLMKMLLLELECYQNQLNQLKKELNEITSI